MKLKNVLLVVEDVDRSKKFYKELFGLEVIADFGENVVLTEGLVLQERKVWEDFVQRKTEYRGNDAQLYFEDANIDNLLKKFHNSEYNIEFLHEPKESNINGRAIRIYDPDGHVIEIGEKV